MANKQKSIEIPRTGRQSEETQRQESR